MEETSSNVANECPSVKCHLSDSSSDYGPDFTAEEEDELSELLDKCSTNPPLAFDGETRAIVVSLQYGDIEDYEASAEPPLLRRLDLSPTSVLGDNSLGTRTSNVRLHLKSPQSVVLPVSSKETRRTGLTTREPVKCSDDAVPTVERDSDPRSPLQRFRTAPQKPLSVTDLVAPTWCELQYWFKLTKPEQRRRTPAMRQGSAVHKTLEDQVHTHSVAIDVHTKTDRWGLRIWNLVQRLKPLRENGLTRELEVLGIVDGEVVVGVIDELSHACPDQALEMQAANLSKLVKPRWGRKPSRSDGKSGTMKDFLRSVSPKQRGGSRKQDEPPAVPTVYITDVKTRMNNMLPSAQVLESKSMQLMLYRRLLLDLASGKVDPLRIFSRYDIDPYAPFSDDFISQIGNAHVPSLSPSPFESSDAGTESDDDALQTLLAHNSALQLWGLLEKELALTFGADPAATLSSILNIEYRGQADGAVLGTKAFINDEAALDRYIRSEMRWWKGERPAQGVEKTEVHKCRTCDFASQCHHFASLRLESLKEKPRALESAQKAS
ncbi:MAG: hypothetical protein M1825_002527 [Sarcosagium campestre]|nr:MAG: hypothetical protein M1825_002527 [Sarcosagium campestre]